MRLVHQFSLLLIATALAAVAAMAGLVVWNLHAGFSDYLQAQDGEHLSRLMDAAERDLARRGGVPQDWRPVLRTWQSLALTPVEFRLLRHPGRVFERAQLLYPIHEDFRDVSDRVVDSHAKNIRRKLGALDPAQGCIASVYGVGYRLDLG